MSVSMSLGDLLALGRQTSADLRAWLEARHPALIERLSEAAESRGETIAQFLRIATADFMAEADEDAWASLVSALRDGEDPGAVCAERVVRFRLQRERRERAS